MWSVQAQIEHHDPNGWEGSRQLPTFYLDPRVQGTLTEGQAADVARDIVTQVAEAVLASAGVAATASIRVHAYVMAVDL